MRDRRLSIESDTPHRHQAMAGTRNDKKYIHENSWPEGILLENPCLISQNPFSNLFSTDQHNNLQSS